MKQNSSSRRLGQELKEKLSSILLFDIADPRLDMVTITGCEVSLDRSLARIYVSADPAHYDEVTEALGAARGRIRSLLARSLAWRVTPELDFRLDRSTDEAERIGRALEHRPAGIDIEKDEDGYPLAAQTVNAEAEDGPIVQTVAAEAADGAAGPSDMAADE